MGRAFGSKPAPRQEAVCGGGAHPSAGARSVSYTHLSIAQMEAGGNAPCPACGFTAASMGKVAAASTSIENGFEYHYEAVAQAAEEYQSCLLYTSRCV